MNQDSNTYTIPVYRLQLVQEGQTTRHLTRRTRSNAWEGRQHEYSANLQAMA